jgi:hypothetical protein
MNAWIPTMINFFARNGTYLALFSIGAAVVLLVVVLVVRRRIAFLKIRNSPPTPAEAFHKYKSPDQPTVAARPTITYRGRALDGGLGCCVGFDLGWGHPCNPA